MVIAVVVTTTPLNVAMTEETVRSSITIIQTALFGVLVRLETVIAMVVNTTLQSVDMMEEIVKTSIIIILTAL